MLAVMAAVLVLPLPVLSSRAALALVLMLLPPLLRRRLAGWSR